MININNTCFQTYSDYKLLVSNFYSICPGDFNRFLNDPTNMDAFFKMIFLDVDAAIPIIAPLYSPVGRPAQFQIQMLRSLVLMAHYRIGSPQTWCQMLSIEPCLAVISGFNPGYFPKFPSFYDFFDRLFSGIHYNRNDYILDHKPFEKPDNSQKPKKGEKWNNFEHSATKKLLEQFSNNIDHTENLDERVLLSLFDTLGVSFSVDHGLIDTEIKIAGDGTCDHEHARSSGKKIDENNNDLRRYSDIDADWGWDSDLNIFYFGYTIYTISTINHSTGTDLPVFLTMAPASQNDAITSMTALAQLCSINNRLSFSHYLLDSASDNVSTHKLAYSLGILPVIDINKRQTGKNIYKPYAGISENGKPICMAGHECFSDGYEKSRFRHKFRCPFAQRKENTCPMKDQCTKSKYGRVFHIKTEDDLRLFGVVRYGSEQWKEIYKDRTCCERMNNRILNNYEFSKLRMRGRKRRFIMLIMDGINIHLDAYRKVTSL